MTTIKVSEGCFNEIAAALEKQGKKIGVNVASISLDKDTSIVDPIDYRLATIRRDCVTEATKVWGIVGGIGCDHIDFIKFADKVYQFVLRGSKEENITLVNLKAIEVASEVASNAVKKASDTFDKKTGW